MIMKMIYLHAFLAVTVVLGLPLNAKETKPESKSEPYVAPSVRIDPNGFGASKRDITKLLDSVTVELWKHFPGYKLEPIVITHHKNGPIVLYRRNAKNEIVVRLACQKNYWSQYSYQWAHEFCHILHGFRDEPSQNKWFEETLAELASIYTLRAMSESWKTNPPYPNWKSYGASLKKYAQNVINTREKIDLKSLAGYYKKHRAKLVKNETLRDLNGAMAVAILPLFEKNPAHWESIRYLNVTPTTKNMNFNAYLTKWYHDAPKKHHAFIIELSGYFGEKIKTKK